MANVDNLAKLLSAVANQDWNAARAAGLRLADTEEKKGHHGAAQLLRGALLSNGHAPAAQANGHALGDVGLLDAALTRLSGSVHLKDVSLRGSHRAQLLDIVAEWKHRRALEARGIAPRRKLLLHGPPGCGKSMTARALGTELGLPTYVIRIDAVVGAYLGQTALRIRQLFDFAERMECVLLLDEVDAIGTRRGSQRDVGEIDRVVISLMQELEHSKPRGLVVATSNVPKQLDDALFRRFDVVIDFPRPNRTELLEFARMRARARKLAMPNLASLIAGAKSYAEAERRLLARERTMILANILRS